MGKWLQNLFIPHEGNGHKPHMLRPRVVAFACLIAVIAELGFVFTATYVVPRTKFFGIIDANALVDETNAARQSENLSDLTVSPLLTQAAQEKANDMATNNYFAHTSPSGLTPWYWFEQVGYAFSFAGENLAVNFTDSQDVTNAWMNSPEHRANILDTSYTQIGIATAEGTYNGEPATYVVEEFGTPASQPIAFFNSASAAAAAPATAPVSASVHATTTPAAPATSTVVVTTTATTLPQSGKVIVAPATVTVPTKATSTTKGATKPKTVPAVSAVVRTSTLATATAQPVSIVVPAAALTPTGTTATATPMVSGGTIRSAPQTNALQRLISNPTALTDDFYFALIALFAIAIILNTFIKIQVQFPQLILGGLVVVVVAGLLVLYNQDLGILHTVIL